MFAVPIRIQLIGVDLFSRQYSSRTLHILSKSDSWLPLLRLHNWADVKNRPMKLDSPLGRVLMLTD